MASVQLAIEIDAHGNVTDVGKVERSLDRAGAEAGNLDRQLDKVRAAQQRVGRAATVMATGLLAGLGAAAYQAAQYGDQIAKAATKTGMTADAVSRLGYAAEQSGVGFGELEMGLARMQRSAAEAASGSEMQAEAFAELGVAVRNSNGELKSGEELFNDVAEGLRRTKNDTERAALAMDIFGRSGVNMLPLLMQGKRGIDALGQEAARTGRVIDDETARAAEAFTDSMSRIKLASQSAVMEIGKVAFGATDQGNAIADTIGKMTNWMREHETLTGVLVRGAGYLAAFTLLVRGAGVVIGATRDVIGGIRTVLTWYNNSIRAAATAQEAAATGVTLHATAIRTQLIPSLMAAAGPLAVVLAGLYAIQGYQKMGRIGARHHRLADMAREYSEKTGREIDEKVTLADRKEGAQQPGSTADDYAAIRWFQKENERAKSGTGTKQERAWAWYEGQQMKTYSHRADTEGVDVDLSKPSQDTVNAQRAMKDLRHMANGQTSGQQQTIRFQGDGQITQAFADQANEQIRQAKRP